ncbi:MAG: flavodoxin family protein [Anaerobutyricum sp.]
MIITEVQDKGVTQTLLATAFVSGAVAAGNEVEVFDAATANLHGCSGDKSCQQRGYCGQKDDGVQMNELMRQADVLVLVSPIYWSGFTSQIKRAIDRFYQFSFPKGRETLHIKELYLIAASASPDPAII